MRDEEESATTEMPKETSVATKENRKTVKTAAHAQVKNVIVNATVEMVTFELDDELRPGEEYYFQLLYTGEFDKQLSGLYLSQYTDGTGKRKYAAVTQMQPTDARRMVPCFDEPEFKAVWKVKIIHPSGTVAISNGIELKDAIKTLVS
uniref:Peptidase_M1_N domain-containing protein n=1 Tax=Ascaris lumbricoides TaxID=6252 RepID=A0A0M3ITZ1_ASCLU